MGIPTEKRLEWERLLTGHSVDREDLPMELQELLQALEQKRERRRVERSERGPPSAEDMAIPASPHRCRGRTNPHLTPGTGMLPDPEGEEPNLAPTS